MPIIQTADITPESLHGTVAHQVYCGLDNCISIEVRQAEEALFQSHPLSIPIYSFERALQSPYLDIMNRGFPVNQPARSEVAAQLEKRIHHLQSILNQISAPFGIKSLNPRSSTQLKDFFYSKLKFPEIYISQKGVRKLSLNREVLERLYNNYLFARPFVNCILSIRELAKQLEVFQYDIDSDGRFRTSYNIAGTETGRPSSSSNAFGTGGNFQNIAPALRYVFVADKGWKLCVIDFEQVEARDVGYFCGCLFNDWSFLDACESGDLHTANARRIWPELGWGEDSYRNRQMADQQFYREFTYRDMAKRGSHLSNYMGTAFTAARSLKVPQSVMEEFQSRYCRGPNCAYPSISLYWQWIAEQIQTHYSLTTPFGRKRHFFSHPRDDATIREAIAFLPQSTTADRTNLCLWRFWKHLPQIQLLAQTYDSITFQYREEEDEDSLIQKALALMKVELFAPNDRSYIVPGEAKIGWNWGNQVTQDDADKAVKENRRVPRLNKEGLRKWKPKTERVI